MNTSDSSEETISFSQAELDAFQEKIIAECKASMVEAGNQLVVGVLRTLAAGILEKLTVESNNSEARYGAQVAIEEIAAVVSRTADELEAKSAPV